MSSGLLIDSRPLVALLSERDQYHASCLEVAKTLRGPFFTSWPVITEAAHLLKSHPRAIQQLLAWVRTSEIHLVPLAAEDAAGIADILTRYSDQSFDFADVFLMHTSPIETGLATSSRLVGGIFPLFGQAVENQCRSFQIGIET